MPKRRPGINKNYNTDIGKHLLFLVEGLDTTQTHSYIDNFENKDHMLQAWKENRQYLLNLFFYGTEEGQIGGYGAGRRPAGWWLCESKIREYFLQDNRSGVIGDEVFIDGQYYDELKDFAVKSKYIKDKPYQFKLNQYKYLKDHDLLFKWEKKK